MQTLKYQQKRKRLSRVTLCLRLYLLRFLHPEVSAQENAVLRVRMGRKMIRFRNGLDEVTTTAIQYGFLQIPSVFPCREILYNVTSPHLTLRGGRRSSWISIASSHLELFSHAVQSTTYSSIPEAQNKEWWIKESKSNIFCMRGAAAQAINYRMISASVRTAQAKARNRAPWIESNLMIISGKKQCNGGSRRKDSE